MIQGFFVGFQGEEKHHTAFYKGVYLKDGLLYSFVWRDKKDTATKCHHNRVFSIKKKIWPVKTLEPSSEFFYFSEKEILLQNMYYTWTKNWSWNLQSVLDTTSFSTVSVFPPPSRKQNSGYCRQTTRQIVHLEPQAIGVSKMKFC